MPFMRRPCWSRARLFGPSAVTCSNAAAAQPESAGRIGAVRCLLLAELQMRVVVQCLRLTLATNACAQQVAAAAAPARRLLVSYSR